MNKHNCNNKLCKKIHYIKPAMSSVFKYKEYPDGRIEELPKPEYAVDNPNGFCQPDWPIDYMNYKLVKKST